MRGALPLRVALFSGNYNYIRDGANQALNRLVAYLLRQGVAVRVYSATTKTPAFAPVGDLVSVPSFPFPGGREEYRVAWGLTPKVRKDLERFAPNIVHVSAPDLLGHAAIAWARQREVPILASMHTRFETYFQYYGLRWVVPFFIRRMRRFYNRTDKIVAPSRSMADIMRAWGVTQPIDIWARGIDKAVFNPGQRSLDWRRSLGIGDGEAVIGFLGRLVMEKGIEVFASAIAMLKARSIGYRVLVIGEGPARGWFETHVPDAIFVGHLADRELGQAVASLDIFFNPSVTETFGNVTVEAMASGLPVVAADATGSKDIVRHGVTGQLVEPGNAGRFADALAAYCSDPQLKAQHASAGLNEARRYDWDEVNHVVLDAYRTLVAQR